MLQELHLLSLLLLNRRTVTEALRNQFWLEHKLLFERMLEETHADSLAIFFFPNN